MIVEYVDISKIKPANYNPRQISEKQFTKLKQSISEIGFVIPILVNRNNNTIIAGHQRTKAAIELEIKKLPVIFVDGLQIGDEIKFNQIHNAIDKNQNIPTTISRTLDTEEFINIDVNNFILGDNSPTYVKEICKILIKYGNVITCVVCKDEVILGADYIKSCQLLGLSVNVFACDKSKYEYLKKYLTSDYGEYSYDKIERYTYVQGLAQLYRSTTKKDGKKQQASTLYENLVMPYLLTNDKNTSILDFGCGKGAYIKMLAKKYYTLGIEFFNNNGKSIDVASGNLMIDNLISRLKTNKQFDVVVCDSVLNSVDSSDAELSVIRCLNLFCNHKLFISGRPIDTVINKYNLKKDRYTNKRFLEFLDKDNFSANYRRGKWYFQHYHSKEKITELLEENGFKVIKITWAKYGDSFQIEADKTKYLTNEEYVNAINFEFNLPLPNGRRYNRHNEIKEVLEIID